MNQVQDLLYSSSMKLFGLEFLKRKQEPRIPPVESWNWAPAHPDWLSDKDPFPLSESLISFNVKSKFTLIIGKQTAECGALVQEMITLGKPFVFINFDELEDAEINVHLKREKRKANLVIGSKSHCLSKVTSVYLELPSMMHSMERTPSQFTEAETVYIKRWLSLLRDLPFYTPNARWIPGCPEDLLDCAQKKLSELGIAQERGLLVPETLLTSSPKEAEGFYKKHKGKVLYRDFGTKKVFDDKGVKTFEVGLLNPAKYDWSRVAETPCVFQRYIDKKYDIRVVVVGKHVLVAKIHSQRSGTSKIDWREYDYKNVQFESAEIPKDVASGLKAFLKANGMLMGSFDIAVDKKNRHYFLEMNRPGAWLFLEALSGLKIRRAIAKSL